MMPSAIEDHDFPCGLKLSRLRVAYELYTTAFTYWRIRSRRVLLENWRFGYLKAFMLSRFHLPMVSKSHVPSAESQSSPILVLTLLFGRLIPSSGPLHQSPRPQGPRSSRSHVWGPRGLINIHHPLWPCETGKPHVVFKVAPRVGVLDQFCMKLPGSCSVPRSKP